MNRRRFLTQCAAASLLGGGTWAWSLPRGPVTPRLVVVFLRGAYDGLSAFYPHNNAWYRQARPRIGLPGLSDAIGALRLSDQWAMHPALTPHLGDLWTSGHMAVVPYCGAPYVTRSHFQAQDAMELASADPTQPRPVAPSSDLTLDHSPTGPSGWVNRLLSELGADHAPRPPTGPDPTAVTGLSLTGDLPLAWRGPVPVANAALPRAKQLPPRSQRSQDVQVEHTLARMYRGHALQTAWAQGLGVQRQLTDTLASANDTAHSSGDPASRLASTPNAFALEAQRAGQFLRRQPSYRLAWLETGGWDTHQYQGQLTGTLARHLDGLGLGLRALHDELGPDEWKQTTVVVMSEFGRTFAENGTSGTDHGWGNTWFVLGGALAQAGLWGNDVPLTPEILHEGRELPVLNPYPEVLSRWLGPLYGLSPQAMLRVFPLR